MPTGVAKQLENYSFVWNGETEEKFFQEKSLNSCIQFASIPQVAARWQNG